MAKDNHVEPGAVTALERIAVALERLADHFAQTQAPGLMDAKQAAARLGVSPFTVYNLAKKKAIPSTRIGKAVRFEPADVEEYKKANESKKPKFRILA